MADDLYFNGKHMNKDLSVILFDLGGVLVELPERPIPAGWVERSSLSGHKLSWLVDLPCGKSV